MRIFRSLNAFLKKEESPTFVEYGLMILLIALAVVAGATLFGISVNGLIQSGADAF